MFIASLSAVPENGTAIMHRIVSGIITCIPESGGDLNYSHQGIIIIININRCLTMAIELPLLLVDN